METDWNPTRIRNLGEENEREVMRGNVRSHQGNN
jgi:hypothetical protein